MASAEGDRPSYACPVDDSHQPPSDGQAPLHDPVDDERFSELEGDAIKVPIGPDGEPDWDAYYSDPRFRHFIGPQDLRPGVPLIRRYSANGSVMAAVALGFREVFDPHRAKVEIVQERDDSGDPDHPDKAFHLEFDPDDPTATRAIVRPHRRGEPEP